jgi:diguanylate cyclase (GGDEF)-like protein/PAS domain S-box-containing protein
MQKDACQEQAFFVRGITALLHLLSSKDYQFRRKNTSYRGFAHFTLNLQGTVLLANLQLLFEAYKKTKTCFGERFQMDLRTVLLMLTVGSFLFGLLLVRFKFDRENPREVPYWIAAKFLQATGSLLLYLGMGGPLMLLAKTVLILGCAHETWAIAIISGKKIKRWLHAVVDLAIIAVCALIALASETFRSSAIFSLQSIFYFLPFGFLVHKPDRKFSLQVPLGVLYLLTGLVFLVNAAMLFFFPGYGLSGANVLLGMIPIISFCVFLASGFILLMLSKERSDLQMQQIQKSLKETEDRFRLIVETAIEGIMVFDEHYRITFANKNMASMLEYTVEEMLGRSYSSFFAEEDQDIYREQEALRKSGRDSVYECGLLTKSGKKHWFLISARPLLGQSNRFEGSFAMLTDINERKVMEMALAEANRQLIELSNRDGLTGISNRRRFDTFLESEFSRLKAENAHLSIIFLDVDHFKAYNDLYGHLMGDECLKQIANVLANCVTRPDDLVARYGGEEFACVLPDTDLANAVLKAEEIQEKVKELAIEHKGSKVSDLITVSFGVATFNSASGVTIEEMMKFADKQLYKAKSLGRNRIEAAKWPGHSVV